MINRTAFPLLALTLLASLTTAQEKYWVAAASGVAQIDASGFPWQTVLPATARDVGVAPDGKVWLLGATIAVLNADGSPFTIITPSAGITPYSVAFDRAGHAWVTGSTAGVEEFDAAGASQGTLVLSAGAPRNICVDASGNKWIAHRVGPPGSVSRIDAVTRAVTNHPLPAAAAFLPIGIYADARGFVNPSHIWTVGDNRGSGAVVELDSTGTVLNTYVLSAAARLLWMCGDCDAAGVTRNLWIGDWGNGDLYRLDVATGLSTNFPQAGGGVGGVNFDGFSNLWITMRTGGVVRRLDETNGAIEISSIVGASSQIATRWQHATVVDQLGDLDGDGAANLPEVMGGSSPFDRCSLPTASLSIRGSMSVGSVANVAVMTGPSSLSLVGFATGTAAVPLVFPGIGCAVQIDPATFVVSFAVVGPGNLAINIPNNPIYLGFRLLTQALDVGASTFTNVAPLRVF